MISFLSFLYKKPKKDREDRDSATQSSSGCHSVMASQEFHKLFQNANEGQEEGQIEGNLPEWMKKENLTVLYNGPVSIVQIGT